MSAPQDLFAADDAPARLRPSFALARVPQETVPPEAPPAPPTPAMAPVAAPAPAAVEPAPVPAPSASPPVAGTRRWLDAMVPAGLGAMATLSAMGWVMERRRRVAMESEKDSVIWAEDQPPPRSSIITTLGNISQLLPLREDPGTRARKDYLRALAESTSRREATLLDLHKLDAKVQRRCARGELDAAARLLQDHVVDFRYTSPWVFLELRELHRQLAREEEWNATREVFAQRFGQSAPAWDAPSRADAELRADAPLCGHLVQLWPYREARMLVLRWMLGDHDMQQQNAGPPLLPLGVYRDLMLLDRVLDEVMQPSPPPPPDSGLTF